MTTWEEHWKTLETPWDAGKPCPALTDLLQEQFAPGTDRVGRALVPGCGRGWDAFEIAAHSPMHAFGLDLAPSARGPFEETRQSLGVPETHAELLVGNFFEFEPEARFDFAWDYTFLCAIDPELRPDWGAAYGRLVRPGGLLAVLAFPVPLPDTDDSGPPHPVIPETVPALLPAFELEDTRSEVRSHPAREGREVLQLYRAR